MIDWKISARQGVRVAALVLAGALGSAVSAQDTDAVPVTRTWVYSAKVVCKNVISPSLSDVTFDFGPAFYRTVLNLRNRSGRAVKLSVRAVEATRIGASSIGAQGRVQAELGPNAAMFIGCQDVRRILGLENPGFRVDGYLIVETQALLDSDVIYTSLSRRTDARADAASIDVEPVRPRLKDSSVLSDSR